jgi:ABC-2 type transport system permease protein
MKELLVDAWIVMQKELRELLAARPLAESLARDHTLGSAHGGWWLAGMVVLLVGVLMPLYVGPVWLGQAWLLMFWAWLPVFLVAGIVADSVAGERERHTLETLLASRLSDRAILLGKMGAAVLYGWGLMLATIAVGVAVINLAYAQDHLLLYQPLLLVGGGLLSLLASVLAAAFGVLISLRASSVRRARRTIIFTLLVLLLLQLVAAPLLLRLQQPDWHLTFQSLLARMDSVQVIGGLAMLLLAADAALLWVAANWFRRQRLQLD